MRPPLTVELPDQLQAVSLRSRLQLFDVETIAVDGHWELRINLVDQNPESRIAAALNAIDAWLAADGVNSVRVHLDGSSYTLHVQPVLRPTAV
jgi:hypothetical protein